MKQPKYKSMETERTNVKVVKFQVRDWVRVKGKQDWYVKVKGNILIPSRYQEEPVHVLMLLADKT